MIMRTRLNSLGTLLLIPILLGMTATAWAGWTQINMDAFDGTAGAYKNAGGQSMAVYGGAVCVGTEKQHGDPASGAEVWKYSGSGTGWTLINMPGFGDSNNHGIEALYTTSANELYAGTTSSAGPPPVPGVWKYSGSGTTWNAVGAPFTNHHGVVCLIEFGGSLYAGTRGWTPNPAKLFKWNSPNWDDVIATCPTWAASFPQQIYCMAVYNGKLYLGTGGTAGAQVWEYNGTTWAGTIIGKPTSPWSTNNDQVDCMTVQDGYLWVGTANNATGGEVWRWDGAGWTNKTGDWAGPMVDAMTSGSVYAGITGSVDKVFQWTGSAWAQVGADGFGNSAENKEGVLNLLVYNNALYATTWNNANGPGSLNMVWPRRPPSPSVYPDPRGRRSRITASCPCPSCPWTPRPRRSWVRLSERTTRP